MFIDLGPGLRGWVDGKATLSNPLEVFAMSRQSSIYNRVLGADWGKFATPQGLITVPQTQPAPARSLSQQLKRK